MKHLSEKLITKARFVDRPVIDFMHCIYLYGNIDEAIKVFSDRGFTYDKDVLEIIKNIQGDLSSFINNEISYFSELGIVDCLPIALVCDYSEIKYIEDFFEVLGNMSTEKLFDYIGGLFLSSYLPDNNDSWPTVSNSLPEMKKYIEDLSTVDQSLKKEVLELFDSPEETQMRISYIFKQFYNKGYKQFQGEIAARSQEEGFRYAELLKADPEKFIEINMKDASINGTSLWDGEILDIYVSYIQQLGYTVLSNCNIKGSAGTLSIGCRNIDFFNSKGIITNFERFLKTIADPTRFKIITLVGQGEWYIQALAKELALTPSTIHHHLETLNTLDIVTSYKEGNKVLYKLNTEVAKQYLRLLEEKILG